MRGNSQTQLSMLIFSNLDRYIPENHPLQKIKMLADTVLKTMSPEFSKIYSKKGRSSVPPERLLKGMLLMALFSIRSERQLCEQLQFNLLFRWFLDMDLTDVPFDPSTFSHNRERLMKHEISEKFLSHVVNLAQKDNLMSDEHFSVDGTLIEAWASLKSFQPKDRDREDDNDNNGWSNFKDTTRSNETHESTTDKEARLMRKGNGKEAKMSYGAHALMENRNGLIVDLSITQATGTCEREAAIEFMDKHMSSKRKATLGADAGYNTKDFVKACRERNIQPHVSLKKKGSAIDGRTTRHSGYEISQVVRRRIEQIFGWLKSYGGLRKGRFKGRQRISLYAQMAGAAYNLMRISKLQRMPT